MSFKHRVDFECDGCGVQHSLDEGMELPPKWIGVQIAVADNEGIIPEQEQECFAHFCSTTCFCEYAKSEEMKERVLLSDVHYEDEDDDDEDEDYENGDGEENGDI